MAAFVTRRKDRPRSPWVVRLYLPRRQGAPATRRYVRSYRSLADAQRAALLADLIYLRP